MARILFLTNSINGLYSFRRELVQRILEEGHEVTIVAPIGERTPYFVKIGCNLIESKIDRRGTNPINDFKLLLRYIKILNDNKPNVVLTYTIKPNVYGGFACRLLNIPYLVNVTGLGTSIENGGFLQKASLFLYKQGLKNAECVFFQNETNKRFFEKKNILNGKSRLIPGSGVSLETHSFETYPKDDKNIKFLFIGRIMKAKGIDELLQAAKIIKNRFPHVHFDLIGPCEENYKEILKEYESKNIIRYHGRQNNVHYFIKESHALINPSYHEGMSNVLLESASTGRPVLASNIPGCRETFDEGISGLGFEPKNIKSLVETLIKFIELPYEKKKKMGILGRKKMEQEFDRNFVIDSYINEINQILIYKKERPL